MRKREYPQGIITKNLQGRWTWRLFGLRPQSDMTKFILYEEIVANFAKWKADVYHLYSRRGVRYFLLSGPKKVP